MTVPRIRSVSVHELAQQLNDLAPPQLLDCREAVEYQFCRIENALHIPMSEIRSRFSELDASCPIVVYCHHGVRSQSVAGFLMQQGCNEVSSLDGGIDAWSRQIDPNVPRYS